jgi:hypothetical protein
LKNAFRIGEYLPSGKNGVKNSAVPQGSLIFHTFLKGPAKHCKIDKIHAPYQCATAPDRCARLPVFTGK